MQPKINYLLGTSIGGTNALFVASLTYPSRVRQCRIAAEAAVILRGDLLLSRLISTGLFMYDYFKQKLAHHYTVNFPGCVAFIH